MIGTNPDWSRWRISRELAAQWNWRNGAGQLKDMAARTLLAKLHQRGLVQLPDRRWQPVNRMRCSPAGTVGWEQSPIECSLGELQPLQVREISGERDPRRQLHAALAQFHYLGFRGAVGQNLQYAISNGADRPLAFVVFGAAAWKCGDRDRHIGWNIYQRQANLHLIANNSRFLILPWVKVPQLASWVLSRISRRVSGDWQRKYGHGLALLESFVQQDRFAGTAYQAANWRRVGSTAGRTRQDRHRNIQEPIKDIYLYPLRRDFQEALSA